jgi:protocatechuate 3,4-dioxygenase beta subunit
MKKKITRRRLAGQIGTIAGGIGLLGPAAAKTLLATPEQVEGPFYPPEPHREFDVDLTLLEGHSERAAGEVILVRGRVTDTNGQPLAGARVDIWQANNNGRYDHPDDPNPAPLDPNFQGIGITHTDADGWYGFKTIKPAAYELKYLGMEGWRAQHIHFKVHHESAADLITQMYFEGDALLEQDEDFNKAPEAQRPSLVTTPVNDDASGLPLHRFDVVLA